METRKALGLLVAFTLSIFSLSAIFLLLKTSPGRPPPGPTGTPPTASPKPGMDVTDVEYQEYLHRCVQATKGIARANVVFDPEMTMTRGSSSTVTAVVTLNTQLPPDQVLPGKGAASEQLYVACEIEGSLFGDEEEFSVRPTDWQSRSLIGDQDAKWTWVVKPRMGGTRSLVMDLRPVVKVEDASGELKTQSLTTVSFESTVHVRVPADQAISDAATRAKVMFDSLSGLIKAMTLLVAVSIALGTALGLRRLARWIRQRRRRPADAT